MLRQLMIDTVLIVTPLFAVASNVDASFETSTQRMPRQPVMPEQRLVLRRGFDCQTRADQELRASWRLPSADAAAICPMTILDAADRPREGTNIAVI